MEPVCLSPLEMTLLRHPMNLDKVCLTRMCCQLDLCESQLHWGVLSNQILRLSPQSTPGTPTGAGVPSWAALEDTATPFGPFPDPCSPQWWWGGDFHSHHSGCSVPIALAQTKHDQEINGCISSLPYRCCNSFAGGLWAPVGSLAAKPCRCFPQFVVAPLDEHLAHCLKKVLALLVVCLCFNCPPTGRQRCFMVFREAVGTLWGFEQLQSRRCGRERWPRDVVGFFTSASLSRSSAVMVGTACSPTCIPSASQHTTAQTPACLQLIALEKQRQHLIKHLVIPKIKRNERKFPKILLQWSQAV